MSNEKSKQDLIEMRILGAVREMLSERVNELLGDLQFHIPLIEFGGYGCGYAVSPVITLSACERSEKERIIRLDAYSLTISFSLPETFETESHCYAYSAAVCMALKQNPTLGGVADKAVVTGEKYIPPKTRNCGHDWEVVLSLRITVEGMRQ